ncbi:MAG TPA: hypothetical protein VEQ58_18955 [Polyangiaceae bacterium]|nr:hypothetical protein [Polyangiaceae bacterium]
MTTQAVHRVDVTVALIGIIGWTIVMISLSKTTDRRARWARFAMFSPFYEAYERLPATWGRTHALLFLTTAVWLVSMLVTASKLRTTLSVVAGASLAFLAVASALSA